MITYTSKRNREHQVPEIVRDYNLFIGGKCLWISVTCAFICF